MGGDKPLDFMGRIAGLCGLHLKADNPYAFSKEILESNLDRITLNIQNSEEFAKDNEIAWQVFGHLLLEYKVEIPEGVKEYIVNSLNYDPFAKKDINRQEMLELYLCKLAST